MRVLYVACGSGSDPTIGGSLTRSIEIAKRLKAKVYFLTTTGGKYQARDLDTYEIKTPIGYWQMDKWFILRQIWSYFLVFLKSPFLKLPNADILYLDSDGLWDIIPALWYKLKHPKVLLISMNHHLTSNPINRIHQWVSHKFIRRMDVVFCLDSPMGRKLARVINHPKTYFVENGIDLELINSIPEQEKKYDLCFFGTPRPGKGLEEVRLYSPLVIGDILPIYRKLLPDVEAMGFIPDKREVIKIIKQCRYFIIGEEEGWGIGIRECVACGLKPYNKNIDYKIIDWNEIAKKEQEIYEDLLRTCQPTP